LLSALKNKLTNVSFVYVICGSFEDAVSNLGYLASSGMVIDENEGKSALNEVAAA
jgi:hypothetical protein